MTVNRQSTDNLVIALIWIFIINLLFGIVFDICGIVVRCKQLKNDVKIEEVESLNTKLPPNLEMILEEV